MHETRVSRVETNILIKMRINTCRLIDLFINSTIDWVKRDDGKICGVQGQGPERLGQHGQHVLRERVPANSVAHV